MNGQIYEEEPDLGDVVELGANYVVARVHTNLPGVITSVRESSGEILVDVDFVIRERYEDMDLREDDPDRVKFRKLQGSSRVPYLQLAAGGGAMGIAIYPQVGDEVVLQVHERSLQEWLTTGLTDISPKDPRRWDLDDVVALPTPTSVKQRVDFARDGAIVVKGPEVRLADPDATTFLSRDDRVQQQLVTLQAQVNAMRLALTTLQGAAPTFTGGAVPIAAYTAAMTALSALGNYTPGQTKTDSVKGT